MAFTFTRRISAVRDFPPNCGGGAQLLSVVRDFPPYTNVHHQTTAFLNRTPISAPMRGGFPIPSAVRDFPPNCGGGAQLPSVVRDFPPYMNVHHQTTALLNHTPISAPMRGRFPIPSAVRDFPPNCGGGAQLPSVVRDFPPYMNVHHQTTAFLNRTPISAPMRGGFPIPSAVRDFPPNCGGGVVAVPAAPPAAGDDGADHDDSMSALESDGGADEYGEEDTMHTSERDGVDEYFEDLMPSTPERNEGEQFSEDFMRSLERDDYETEDFLRSLQREDDDDDDDDADGYEEEDLMFIDERDDDDDDGDDDGYEEEDLMATPERDEGLPEEVIAAFLKTAAATVADGGDSEVCAVCLDDLHQEDRAVGVLCCRHCFHGDCIRGWLRKKNDCPLCRAIAVKIL